MRFIYSLLTRAAAPIAFGVVLWRGVRDHSYWQGLAERFGLGAKLPSPSIWLHAVSLGEMSAAAPLVRALHSRYPQLALAVTAATPAGRARARDLFADVASIRFLPYDTPGSVRRFLQRIQPCVAVRMTAVNPGVEVSTVSVRSATGRALRTTTPTPCLFSPPL